MKIYSRAYVIASLDEEHYVLSLLLGGWLTSFSLLRSLCIQMKIDEAKKVYQSRDNDYLSLVFHSMGVNIW